jgi:phthiodiolone/phenolphthiodiolone dimycocerosates ketoreductase
MTGQPPIIVLGSGEGQNIVPWGWEIERPVRRVKETAQVMKLLWDSSPSKPVTVETDRFTLKDAFLQLEETAPKPSVHFAANGPLMRKMIGRYADGWVPMMLRPEMIAEDLVDIHAQAAEVGRGADDIEVVYWTSLGLADDQEAGLARIATGAKRQLLAYPTMAARLGAEVTDEYAYRDLVIEKDNEGPVNAEAARIPTSVIERTGVYGTPADCLAMIDEYVEAGVDHFVLRATNSIDETASFFRDHLMPHVAKRYAA